ncbi:MAG: Cytochrome-c oxidase [Bryobacterales bacterium]|nr:Cytochrome-c oxidase [Bryobacterales bacterium]
MLFARNHRTIGLQYFFLSLGSVVLGLVLSLLMRFHLVHPESTLPGVGDIPPELYLAFLTMHGTLMVFFVLTLAPQAAFGNLFLTAQLGTEEMAFPILNMLSFWTTALSLAIMVLAFFATGGGPLSGWTAYPPLSAAGGVAGPGQGAGQTLWLIAIAVFCLATLMSAINFITTTIELRAPGMSLMRMPLTCWNWFITAILSLLAFSVLLPSVLLLLADRLAGTSFFLPSGLLIADQALPNQGGSPLLWEHLFWFFGHPEVYIAILPGMAVVSHVIATFSRRPVFGYRAMVYAALSIGFLGLLVWGHHMFISGINPYSAIAFSVLTLIIAVPSSIKTLNWIATAWGGELRLTTSMLFALGFVSLFITGGLSGLFLGQPVLDQYFHDTTFVVAHFHIIMGVAAIFGIFAATFYWFPLMFGRMLNERLGKLHFYLTFIGAYAIFLPMHFTGFAGNPRRYADLTSFQFLAPLLPIHVWMTDAAYLTAAVQVLFLVNLFWSMKRGAPAVRNPWQATTLEWAQGPVGVVYRGPCDYGVTGTAKDYLMQHEAEPCPKP